MKVPHDTVLEELMNVSKLVNATDEFSMVMAAYLLGFSTYVGFDKCINRKFSSDKSLKYLYEYAKKQNND